MNIPGLSVAILTGRSAACEEEGKATSEKKADAEREDAASRGSPGLEEILQAFFYVCGIELISTPRSMTVVRERFLIAEDIQEGDSASRRRTLPCEAPAANCLTLSLFSSSDNSRISCNLHISAQKSPVLCLRRRCPPLPSRSCRNSSRRGISLLHPCPCRIF